MKEEKVFKSGYAALVGKPNVGKSTLMNMLLQQKVAAVSPRPQTTRRRQLGILTTETMQVIFMDTPGIHKAVHKLGEYMNEEALAVLEDADVLLWLADLAEEPGDDDITLAEKMKKVKNLPPVLLVLNKTDQVNDEQRAARQAAYQQLAPGAKTLLISALNGTGCDHLLDAIAEHLPEGPLYYETEQVTDFYEREIAIDLIREAALYLLRDEVPHEMAVRLDSYQDRGEKVAYISATLFVNRDSHKGIVIGKSGSMLKSIGKKAREEIEALTGRKVYLELRVKVNKNWRNDDDTLQRLGYVPRKNE